MAGWADYANSDPSNWSHEKRLRMINDHNKPKMGYNGWDNPDAGYSRYYKQAQFQQQMEKDRKFNSKIQNAQSMSATKKIGMGGVGIWAGIDTVMNMKQGDDFGTAAMKGVASGMLWATMPGIMTAHMIATTAPGVINAANQWTRQKQSWWYKQHLPNFGGQYQDTRRAQTMRQAAVEAIQGSKLNARSALGGEARILSQTMYRG